MPFLAPSRARLPPLAAIDGHGIICGTMEVILYAQSNGDEPLTKWLHKLRDVQARSIILVRLRRIATSGVLGDYKSMGKGVGELRFDYGPGDRVYAYRDGPLVLLLLAGSSKADQKAAIAQAAAYLKDWKERNA